MINGILYDGMNKDAIFTIATPREFEETAFRVFRFQYRNNSVYKDFCNHLQRTPATVNALAEIPFLPVQFFKTHRIISGSTAVQEVFTSSGTTGIIPAKHYITDISYYRESYLRAFRYFYPYNKNYTILALLPSYLERKNSSLIYMINDLIERSATPDSGFYLDDLEALSIKLRSLDGKGSPVLLIGVSFALLELVEKYSFSLKNTIVMETGGMKGRRKELTRHELHQLLCDGFGVKKIHSEYGMTELLSQAYSAGEGIYKCPPWMKIRIREIEDPLQLQSFGNTGGINIIDLANINSCAFIATQDLGKAYPNGSFEVLGRYDHADIRGCNLMAL